MFVFLLRFESSERLGAELFRLFRLFRPFMLLLRFRGVRFRFGLRTVLLLVPLFRLLAFSARSDPGFVFIELVFVKAFRRAWRSERFALPAGLPVLPVVLPVLPRVLPGGLTAVLAARIPGIIACFLLLLLVSCSCRTANGFRKLLLLVN